jgi:HPt (histidine-containing phosphotransfer) domain-containing protein
MTKNIHTVVIAKDLADLIPVFIRNRQKEIETLRTALAAGDFEQLRQLGHRMRGVGNSYGFAMISEVGKQLEDGVKGGDKAAIAACIGEYADFLDKMQIVYE